MSHICNSHLSVLYSLKFLRVKNFEDFEDFVWP